MRTFDDLQHEIYTAIEEVIFGDTPPAKFEVRNSSPLDPRAKTAGWYIKDGCLIVEAAGIRALEYYGGFEYVSQDHKMMIGPYMIYDGQDDRVAQVIDHSL